MTLGKLTITVWRPHGWREWARFAMAVAIGSFACRLITSGGVKEAVAGTLIGWLSALLVDAIGEPPK